MTEKWEEQIIALLKEIAQNTRPRQKKASEKKNLYQEDFEEFWRGVPNKLGKGKTRKAYIKARKKTSKEKILAGLPKYVKYEANRRKQKDYRPLHPATWLNQERWEDDVSHIETPDEDEQPPLVRNAEGLTPRQELIRRFGK